MHKEGITVNHLATSRRLVILSLTAILASILSFTSLPQPAHAASGAALIARNLHQPTSSDPTYDYHLWVMDAVGKTNAIVAPPALSKGPISSFGGKPMFVLFIPPDRIEVIDLAKRTDRIYPAPPNPGLTLMINPEAPTPYPASAVLFKGGERLLFGGFTDTWYILDLTTGSYTAIAVKRDNQPFRYLPFAQSPADGFIYTNWSCRCDGPPGGVARYDLQGNGEVLDLHLGSYVQASSPTMSPAGYYLYFLAYDADQPLPSQNGPGISSNVIMRYRISDGTSSVIARAKPGVGIAAFTLTSDDPYITYVTGVSATSQQGLIVRVNLATRGAPEPLVTSSNYIYQPIWCGSTLYYGMGEASDKQYVYSYSPDTGETAQAEGQLLGCAP